MKENEGTKTGRDAAIATGVAASAEHCADNAILHAHRGHGLAAEKANHLADVLSGKRPRRVGGNNRLDGPDRIVNGLAIQTRYCQTGKKCIASCFRNGRFRYMGGNGPMLIEVPSDKYAAAVQAMESRISKGQVPGISDPAQANTIVLKGRFTYEQARNVAKSGSIEGLTYDAANGVRLAETAMGVSAAIVFGVSVWNGEDAVDALGKSCVAGLKVGSLAWLTSILAVQLGRTGEEQGLRGITDWVVWQLGPKVASWIANGLYEGAPIYGTSAANRLSKVLRGNLASGAATDIVLSAAVLIRLFKGRMSVRHVLKNLTSTAVGVAGGSVGWLLGSATGASIGSAIPRVGPGLGRAIGGVTGAIVFGSGASRAASAVLHRFVEDDAEEIMGIIEVAFGELARRYVLGEREAIAVLDGLLGTDDLPRSLRHMFAAEDRSEFAREWLRPLVQQQAWQRAPVGLPSGQMVLECIAEAARA